MTNKKENIEIDIQHRKELLDNLRDFNESVAAERCQRVHDAVHEASKQEYFSNRDFYMVLVKTNERDNDRRPVDFMFPRRSCPTPGYNQDVFKYHHLTGALEYLWSIPRKHRYEQIWKNKLKYMYNKETKRLASFVVSMETGELLKWVKKENGDLPDAVIKVNKPTIEA